MIKGTVKFIHKLRVYFLVIIILSFFYTAGLNPVNISVFVGANIGRAVGLNVSVPENPFNKLALELREKENRLNQREQTLDEREQALAPSRQNIYIIILGVGVVLLFILVVFNFYLDNRRKNRVKKK